MKNNKLIYVIDDEQDICQLLCNELNNFGYRAEAQHTAQQASLALSRETPALCIVDLGLPDADGMDLVKELNKQPHIGIIIISGRGSIGDRVLGLEVGADDYITKPFDPRELVARVHSTLRRTKNQQSITTDTLCAYFGAWMYDPSKQTLSSMKGKDISLSTAEADMLTSLLKAPLQILSRDQLLGEHNMLYDRSIDVRMSRLRKKLSSNTQDTSLIKTVYGAGYILTSQVDWKERLSSFAEADTTPTL